MGNNNSDGVHGVHLDCWEFKVKKIMGTRAIVTFHSEWSDKPLANIYYQFDGYIEGVGHTLAEFLKGKTVINGIGANQTMALGFANGMGCLAAQYIASQKEKIGGIYMAEDGDTESYHYHVRYDKDQDKVFISVDTFTGTPEELLVYSESEEA